MKSVLSMIVVFIGVYIIVISGILNFFARESVFYTLLAVAFLMILLAAALLGTPFSKPLIKRRGDDDDKDTRSN